MTAFRSITAIQQASRRFAIICGCLFLASAVFAQESAETLAQRAFNLAASQQFSEVDLVLASLAEDHGDSTARVAAVLYASERSYAAGHRPQAATCSAFRPGAMAVWRATAPRSGPVVR